MNTTLIVDDDEGIRHTLREFLQNNGFATQEASCGAEAVEKFERQRPAAVLLDLKMPRVSGFDVLAWVRRQENLRRMPILVLTSSNHSADIQRAYELGANRYFTKTPGFLDVVEHLRIVILSERDTRAAAA